MHGENDSAGVQASGAKVMKTTKSDKNAANLTSSHWLRKWSFTSQVAKLIRRHISVCLRQACGGGKIPARMEPEGGGEPGSSWSGQGWSGSLGGRV